MRNEWTGFVPGVLEKEIDVRDFIQKNYTPYDGDDAFLAGPTEDTKALWEQVLELSRAEREAGGVLDMDTRVISTITSHAAGLFGQGEGDHRGLSDGQAVQACAACPTAASAWRIKACEDNGYQVDPEIVEFFTKHRKTHNAGVFDAYTPEMRACRSSHIITGLPDAYGRGPHHRRLPPCGAVRRGPPDRGQTGTRRTPPAPSCIPTSSASGRSSASRSARWKSLKKLGQIYGFDISRPAKDAQEAIQWLYFGYLAAVKEQNGAAMSPGPHLHVPGHVRPARP